MSERHLVLWDGDCGLCGRMVAWCKERDRASSLEFAPFQDAPSPPMTPELAVACERSVHVVRADGRVLNAGRACLFILEQIGWKSTSDLLSRAPLIWLVELAYLTVARNRKLFSRFLFRHERLELGGHAKPDEHTS
jgi:predicted DCC family thiol-disulfide oxidoreductase YuxK